MAAGKHGSLHELLCLPESFTCFSERLADLSQAGFLFRGGAWTVLSVTKDLIAAKAFSCVIAAPSGNFRIRDSGAMNALELSQVTGMF